MTDRSSPLLGQFVIQRKIEVPGLLTISETEPSSLDLLVDSGFDYLKNIGTISGRLLNNQHVTLLNCKLSGFSGSSIRVVPWTILYGSAIFCPTERRVSKVTFRTNDMNLLFNDQKLFSYSSTIGKPTSIEVRSRGSSELFTVNTTIGTVSAFREVPRQWKYDVSDGVRISTRVICELEFDEPIDFSVALERVFLLEVFFSIVLGVPQRRTEFKLVTQNMGDHSQADFDLECSGWTPHGHRHQRGPSRIIFGRLIDPSVNYDHFGDVLVNWLSHDKDKREARVRFFECLSDEAHFSVDRLVRAANLFDLLPDRKSVPPSALIDDVRALKRTTKKLSSQHGDYADEFGSVLSALGRFGRQSLRNKINGQASLFRKHAAEYLPDLDLVIKSAVIGRNRYVHGTSKQSLETDNEARLIVFLTETLEFIFGVSDLVEAGWDLRKWIDRVQGFHRFGSFIQNYSAGLQGLKQALQDSI